MDLELRCNFVQCRKVLNTEVDCANSAFSSALVCPACETSLTENDDIVFTDLNPSEDYKSSVLSGLRPDLIIEICSRALSFWTYQTTQEACFQEMLYKNLEEKYSQLEKQVQGVLRDAQSEITSLKVKLQALQKEKEQEKRKAHELAEQLQEKHRQFSKLQGMYDKLRRRTLVPTMQQPVQNRTGNSFTNAGANNPVSGSRQGGVPNQPGLYGENGIFNNRTWNIEENRYRDPYVLRQDYPVGSMTGAGRKMDGNENYVFQQQKGSRRIHFNTASNPSNRLPQR
ncbi:4308_t:CDS:2 [Funneliformis caledonium]|uniref:4308_t:CDS:1 n=1 Tax=Funneliformis caledonium TaxID=1117310 RepID=A0A9N9BJV1_9GLOM|nr:4308_t:CDS:2 [Funneliformis caledonium]